MPAAPAPRLRVLTLSTLFPDASRPQLAPFVVRQTQALAGLPDMAVRVVAPLGLPPFPLTSHPHYAARARLPAREVWDGLDVLRPHFRHWPATGGRWDAHAMAAALRAPLTALRAEFPFDVIDAQFFFPDGPAAIALGQFFGVPVSIKARGADIHYWARRWPTQTQILNAAQTADGLLAVSAALKADMVALGLPDAAIRVHYTGVDLTQFRIMDRSAARAALGMSGPLIVAVGALIPRKRQALLIAALGQLPGVTLVLIGDGPDRAELQRHALAAGLAERIHFLGVLDRARIVQWLNAADAMALPSASEGLANVWLEALACGTPIVITDVGGAREVLIDQRGGQIVPPDASSIAAALRRILRHPPDRAACRALADRFTWAANAQALRDHLLLLAGK